MRDTLLHIPAAGGAGVVGKRRKTDDFVVGHSSWGLAAEWIRSEACSSRPACASFTVSAGRKGPAGKRRYVCSSCTCALAVTAAGSEGVLWPSTLRL